MEMPESRSIFFGCGVPLDVVEHRHLVEEPDILKGTGDAGFTDLQRVLPVRLTPSKKMGLLGAYTLQSEG